MLYIIQINFLYLYQKNAEYSLNRLVVVKNRVTKYGVQQFNMNLKTISFKSSELT